MKKLSIIGLSAFVLAVSAFGCSDEEDDNPGAKAGSSSTGEGGDGATSAKGGTSGKGGSSGKGGTTSTPEGGSDLGGVPSTGGGGAGNMPIACDDVYAERPNGRMAIPADAEGNITIDHLTSDTIWTLEGRLFVVPGQTLTIDPCTLIEGSPKPNAGSLFVPPGAKIEAAGTKDAPIVFTSTSHVFDSAAPWGGIVLMGKASAARVNDATPPLYSRNYEGLSDARAVFGYSVSDAEADDEDSSGTMQYVRIENGGDIIVAAKEINGLSFCGVGSGTTIDHIMVRDQMDDCFEWFGGTVNASYLLCQNSGDDMFDTDLGYRGHLQYLFGRNLVEGTSTDPNGFEWDGDQDDLLAPESEASKPVVSNVTMCGLPTVGAYPTYGAVIRRSIAGGTTIMNAFITGFDNGLDFRNYVGTNADPLITWTDSRFFGQRSANGEASNDDNTVPGDPAMNSLKGDSGFIENDYLAVPANNDSILDADAPEGFDCYVPAGPVAPDAPVDGGTPGAGLDDAGTFVGAGDIASDEGWAAGAWIKWVENDEI